MKTDKEFYAVMRMLVRRATLLDRWRALRKPGHWLNCSKRELLIYNEAQDASDLNGWGNLILSTDPARLREAATLANKVGRSILAAEFNRIADIVEEMSESYQGIPLNRESI